VRERLADAIARDHGDSLQPVPSSGACAPASCPRRGSRQTSGWRSAASPRRGPTSSTAPTTCSRGSSSRFSG
jgi:hypothetical protein